MSLSSYNKLSLWLFTYACSYALFHILPVFLNYEIKNLLMIADLFDILTPFVLIFLIYKIYKILLPHAVENTDPLAKSSFKILLVLGGITFVEGHGMHLSANAIARHLTEMKGSSLYALNFFFDEILGHIFWDSGIVFLSIGLILMGFELDPKKELNSKPLVTIFASLFYGFTYFVNAVEGQTVIFTFPLAIVIPLVIYLFSLRQGIFFIRNAVLSFYFFAYILAMCLFIFWGISHNGFPQFSELGWI